MTKNTKHILLYILSILLFIGTADASWISNSSEVTGLGNIGMLTHPTVFYRGTTPVLIAGEYNSFYGYTWNGTGWASNSSEITGLGDPGDFLAPTVFYRGTTPVLISGVGNEAFYGYTWNGTGWVSNTSEVTGLGKPGTVLAPTVFYRGTTPVLISGEGDGGFFSYTWNGTGWASNSSEMTGLGDIGTSSTPTVFYRGTTPVLISGGFNNFYGYTWNGTGWASNSSEVAGIEGLGKYHLAPTVFYRGTTPVLITGEDNHGFFGYTWNNIPTPPTLTSDLGTHETNHTPAVNFTKGTDSDGNTVTTYIYIDTSNPPTTLEATTTGTSVSIGSNTTLTDGTTYYVRARSWDGSEFSGYSSVDTFRMNSKPSVPTLTAPTDLQTLITLLINFTWAASTDAESDSITYDWAVNGTTQGTGVSGLTTNMTLPEATHNWTARAYDSYEYSNWAIINTFYISTVPGYIYNTACTHGANWANCTWTDPLDASFDHVVITNKTGSNNTWHSNVSKGVQYKNFTGLTKGSYNFSTQAASASHTLNNTVVWLNTTVNNYSFGFSNKGLSASSIYQSSGTETISVNVNDSDGTITAVTVTLTYFGVPFTYNMTHGAGDSWSYDFKSSNGGAYYVTQFNATDDYGETSGTTWSQSFIVVPTAAGGGSPGGGSPGTVSTPTPTSTTAALPVVSTINLKTMQDNPTGQLILQAAAAIGAIMMIKGAWGKNTTTGTLVWGLAIIILSAYGLGWIA